MTTGLDGIGRRHRGWQRGCLVGFVVPPALSSSGAPAFCLWDGTRRFRGLEICGSALARDHPVGLSVTQVRDWGSFSTATPLPDAIIHH